MHDKVESFIAAAQEGDLQTVAVHLSQEMPPGSQDALGRSALHEAVVGGHIDVVAMLLEHGASVDAQDSNGTTPLMEAAATGAVELIERLLAAGGDPMLVDAHGDRAADYAVNQGQEAAAKRLTE